MKALPPPLNPPIRFAARTTHGAGRGRTLQIPTVNFDITAAPSELQFGIYACRITFGGHTYNGSMHYGPRPVFRDSVSLEVHVLDTVIGDFPESAEVDVVARIRDVAMFESPEKLRQAIAHDIELTRGILATCPPQP